MFIKCIPKMLKYAPWLQWDLSFLLLLLYKKHDIGVFQVLQTQPFSNTREVFRTLSDIDHGGFLRKSLIGESRCFVFQYVSTTDVWPDLKMQFWIYFKMHPKYLLPCNSDKSPELLICKDWRHPPWDWLDMSFKRYLLELF